MAGRKMKTAWALIAIFLPVIFLLSRVYVTGEPSLENAP